MALLLFGATGNLSKTRIFPAIKSLGIKDVIALGRLVKSKEELEERVGIELDNVEYIQHSIGSDCSNIIRCLSTYDKRILVVLVFVYNGNLDVMKGVYDNICQIIKDTNFDKVRVVLDKPIGNNESSSREIIDIWKNIKDRNIEIIFMDHYLYKKSIRDSKTYCKDNFKAGIIAVEKSSIEGREGFWESSGGIVADMIQSHMLQSLKKVCGIVIKSSYVSDININEYLYVEGSNYPVFIDLSFKYNSPVKRGEISIVTGKYQKQKKTELEIDGYVIDIMSEKCNAYEIIIDNAIKCRAINSVSESDILESWKITERINRKIFKADKYKDDQ